MPPPLPQAGHTMSQQSASLTKITVGCQGWGEGGGGKEGWRGGGRRMEGWEEGRRGGSRRDGGVGVGGTEGWE